MSLMESEVLESGYTVKSEPLDDSQIVLNVDPKHMDKAQDNMFFDFFSIYAQNCVKESVNREE
jgi:hypothetical protein